MMVPLELSHSIADVQFLNPLSAYVENYTEGPIPFDFSFAFGEHGAMFFEIIEVKRKLEEFAAMPDNWDGYGAIRIAPETKQSAKSAVEAILRHAPVPDITPNANGTVSFEWETNHGIGHLEVGRTKFSFYIKPESGEPLLIDGRADEIPVGIGKWVAAFLFPARHAAEPITKITYPSLEAQRA